MQENSLYLSELERLLKRRMIVIFSYSSKEEQRLLEKAVKELNVTDVFKLGQMLKKSVPEALTALWEENEPEIMWTPKIKHIADEDYDKHYGSRSFNISYKDKTILDLGAFIGDSAEYFLHVGAKLVIAVEGDRDTNLGVGTLFPQLEKNVKEYFGGSVIPINCWIDKPEQIEEWILAYKPGIVKADIEGAEIHLFNMKDEIWKMVPEYIVECHATKEAMRERCKQTNYKILSDVAIFNHMIYAVRE